MRRAQLVEIQELRNSQRLLVPRYLHVLLALIRFLDTDAERVPRDLERHVLRIDTGQRNVNLPALVSGVHLERAGRASRCARGQIAPELVEEAIHIPLQIEEVVKWTPTG
jgi:hypothetical protein